MASLGDFALALLVFFSFVPVQFFLHRWIPSTASLFDYKDVLPPGITGRIASFYVAASGAFVEEVFFRGLLAMLIAPPRSAGVQKLMYVCLSAALFGLSHWGQGVFMILATSYLGAAAALLYLRSRVLWPLIIGHLVLDIAAR